MNRLEFRLASPEDAQKVAAFNRRLAAAGESNHHLSVEKPFRTMSHTENSPITVEKLLCFEGNEVRGGVGVKRMTFQVNGRPEEVAFAVYPLSEGIINRAYGAVGLMIREELLRRYPLTYGLGAINNAPAKVRQLTGWFYSPVCFHFAVLHPYPFVRNMTYLRRKKATRILLDSAAFSALCALGFRSLNLIQQLRGRYPRARDLSIERFDEWGEWADQIWQTARDRYSLIGDRSRAALASLYPAGHAHLVKLCIREADNNRPIGWAVLTLARLKNHNYFGDMMLAGLVDMLAVPENAYAVASGALSLARQMKADLLIANHSDSRWNQAFKRAGMLSWKTNFYLSLSPELQERFDFVSDSVDHFFFTRGDGHGPTRLWMSDYYSDDQVLETSPSNQTNLLGEKEKQQILLEWNDTEADYPRDKCIQQLFEVQVEQTPEAVAVVCENGQLTYRELNRRANQLAHFLQKLGVGSESRVGISLERSLEMIVGLLGILKAGGAYVPLDPAYPRERLAYMIEDAGINVLLSQEKWVSELPEYRGQVVRLDSDWAAIAGEDDKNPVTAVAPNNLAYVIYTSGSTGEPKGVMIEQHSLVNYTEAASAEYQITSADRVLQFASINFDASVEEIFPTLTRGATLVLRNDAMLDPSTFLKNCQEWDLTVVSLPTAYWHELTSRIVDGALALPASVRLVVIGGEEAIPQRVKAWREAVGESVRLVNTYGPTEATVVATACDLTGPGAISGELEVPIGKPLHNLQVYVLDQWLQPVAVSVPGELVIGGEGLARGYLNRPDLTAEKFVRHPFSNDPQSRVYKTGDIVRYRADGNLEFLGRVDEQVKIRGFRIEPGEIEAVLRQHPAIRDAIVLAKEDAGGGKRLVAYILVSDPASSPTTSELFAFLKSELPDYMVPSAFVTLNRFPLTPSGKVDRQALPALDKSRPELEREYVAPRNDLERFLSDSWKEILGVEKIGVFDNFFELGGDSIKGAVFINKLQEVLGEYVYVVALFDAPTIDHLAVYLQEHYPGPVTRIFSAGTRESTRTEEPALISRSAGHIDRSKVEKLRKLISPLPARNGDQAATGKNPQAIFVLSAPRSGSTLLRVMLAGHPQLFVPPELDLLSFNTLEDRKNFRLKGGNLGFLEGTIRAIMEIKDCDAEYARRIMEDFENQKLTAQQFYRRMQEWLGERRLVDKSTSYALDLEVLKRAETDFDNPLFIHLLRHPYGMIHSFVEVRLDRIFFRYGHNFSVRELAELVWLISHQNILEFLGKIPDHRQHRVKYEDLVNEPRLGMERICQFLGLEYHPDMVQPYKDKKKRMTDGIHKVSRMIGDVKFHEHKAIDSSTADRWKQHYTGDFLGDITWQIAEKFGYERLTEMEALSGKVNP